jgi:hypothetical protein
VLETLAGLAQQQHDPPREPIRDRDDASIGA